MYLPIYSGICDESHVSALLLFFTHQYQGGYNHPRVYAIVSCIFNLAAHLGNGVGQLISEFLLDAVFSTGG